MNPLTDLASERHELAVACRVMAHRGLVENVLGHVSLRVDDQHVLVRCRGPLESGLAFTVPNDIRLVNSQSGQIVDDDSGGYSPPSELPIHLGVLAARSDVACVVHAHPPKVVVASITDSPMVPLIGAYDIPACRLAHDGIAVHPRSVLIRNSTLAAGMVRSLGSAAALVLTGHGLVTVGTSVPQAVLRALAVNTLAEFTLAVRAVGAQPTPIAEADFAELPDLGSGFNEQTLWRHHVTALDAAGKGLSAQEDQA